MTDNKPTAAAPGFVRCVRWDNGACGMIAVRHIQALYAEGDERTELVVTECDPETYHGTPEDFAAAIAEAHRMHLATLAETFASLPVANVIAYPRQP